MKILAPIATGSGAYLLHEQLSKQIPGYRLRSFSPWWTLFPPALPWFARGRADLIHSDAAYGAMFRRRRRPLVVTVHGYVCDRFMRSYSTRLQYLHYRTDLRLLIRLSLQHADRVVVVSGFLKELVRQDLGVDVPIDVIYNGVDERRFTPLTPVPRMPRRPVRVLFCGKLRAAKGAGMLVPLANALGGDFEICHVGSPLTALHRQGTAHGSAAPIRPLGQITHDKMPDVYRSVDMLLMPSIREGFGLCVAEAMACGLPVVATNGSAIPELVHHRSGGILCSADDIDAFEKAIRSIAGSRSDAQRMGEYNRALVEERFTLDRMTADYRRLFDETLDGAVER